MHSKEESAFRDLEKVNQIIDLCIDQDLYDILDKMFKLSLTAEENIKVFRSRDNRDKKESSIDIAELPVLRISLEDGILGSSQQLIGMSDIDLRGGALNAWSFLFWAKLIRAEIRKHNKDSWSGYYDYLIYFLEKHIPKPEPNGKDSYRLLFHFLMELSAAAFKESSYGYAERARGVIPKFAGDTKKDRKHRD